MLADQGWFPEPGGNPVVWSGFGLVVAWLDLKQGGDKGGEIGRLRLGRGHFAQQ